MLQEAVRVLLVFAVLTVVLFFGVKRSDLPMLDCVTVNSERDNYKVLIVGKSWACDGKLFPELPATISDRLNGRGVQVCSLCFAGRNSRHLYNELSDKLSREKLYDLCGGGRPDKVIFMTGVNDEIQHVGESAYVEYTKKLVEYFSDVPDEEVISIPRVNEFFYKPPILYSVIKQNIFRCFYDGCDYVVNDRYRMALWRDHPELHMIEFDNFINRYLGNERCYKKDGVHLTDACSHKYGAFIGKSVSLNTRMRSSALADAPR